MKDPVWQECRRKKKYASEAEALRAASSEMRANLRVPDLGVYNCPWCQGWHLYRIQEED